MRKLTAMQKKALSQWSRLDPDLRGWADLSLKQMEFLEQLNNTEILVQNVDSFLWDLRMQRVNA